MRTVTPVNRIKSRYLSFRNEGREICIEDVSKTMSRDILKEIALKKLHLIRQALPQGNWSIRIEQEVRDGGFNNMASHYESYDPETGREERL